MTTSIVDQLNLENTKISTLIAGMSDEGKIEMVLELTGIALGRVSDVVADVVKKNDIITEEQYRNLLAEAGYDPKKKVEYDDFVKESLLWSISVDEEYKNSSTSEAVGKMENEYRKAFSGFVFSLDVLKNTFKKLVEAFENKDPKAYTKVAYENRATLIVGSQLVK